MSKYLFFLIFFCILSGCAGRYSEPLSEAEYRVEGKLAVRNNARSQTANFRWRQTRETYDVELWGLLGQGRTRFSGGRDNLTVTRGGEILASGQPREVMQQHLGFSLPVAVMASWLTGQPGNQATAIQTDDAGQIVGFTEQEWRVEFARFRDFEHASGSLQPARIVASREHQKVTVAIRRFLQ